MSWAGCQNNLIDVNFHLQKSLEIFEKKSADKIWSKKDKGIKVSPPVPNRVKSIACGRVSSGLAYLRAMPVAPAITTEPLATISHLHVRDVNIKTIHEYSTKVKLGW